MNEGLDDGKNWPPMLTDEACPDCGSEPLMYHPWPENVRRGDVVCKPCGFTESRRLVGGRFGYVIHSTDGESG